MKVTNPLPDPDLSRRAEEAVQAIYGENVPFAILTLGQEQGKGAFSFAGNIHHDDLANILGSIAHTVAHKEPELVVDYEQKPKMQ